MRRKLIRQWNIHALGTRAADRRRPTLPKDIGSEEGTRRLMLR